MEEHVVMVEKLRLISAKIKKTTMIMTEMNKIEKVKKMLKMKMMGMM